MCKHYEYPNPKDPEYIVDQEQPSNHSDKSDYLAIWVDKTLDNQPCLHTEADIDFGCIVNETEIKYCPICGRKLVESLSNELEEQ